MSTLRSACIALAAAALTACVTSGGSVGEPASDNEAAIANMNLGAGYLRQGNMELAIERLQRALVQAHTTIALAYDLIGNLEEAESHFKRATELDSSDGSAANGYAAFLCTH